MDLGFLYVFNFPLFLRLGDVNPIKTIFETCDVESDKKLSMEEIMENANCLKVLQMAGMQIAGLKDGFSMIDKDEDGYVSMEEAKTLNRDMCGHSCWTLLQQYLG